VHFLTLNEDRRRHANDDLAKYLQRVSEGRDVAESFEFAFGLKVDDIDEALFEYLDNLSAVSMAKNAFTGGTTSRARLISESEMAYRLGTLALLARRLEQSEHLFGHALRIDPNFSRAHAGLGDALKFQGRMDEAEAPFRRSVELSPAEPLNHLDLGEFLSDKAERSDDSAEREKLFHEARRYFAASQRLDPDIPETYWANGRTYFEHGDSLAKGLASLEEAHYRLPSSAEISLDLASAYIDLDQAEKSRPILETLLVLSHSSTYYREAVEALLAKLDSAGEASTATDGETVAEDPDRWWRPPLDHCRGSTQEARLPVHGPTSPIDDSSSAHSYVRRPR
jgi:tetratricopeptide (TPR) repeat protein